MLQLNPNEIIRITKLMNQSLDTIKEHITYLKRKYIDTETFKKYDIDNIENLTNSLERSTTFLNQIINELTEATGENIDKLLSSNHSLSYYENKLLSHYAKNLNNENQSKLDKIDLCYSKDDKLTSFCNKQNFIDHINSLFDKFNESKYGLNKETIINDLSYIYEKRGSSEAYAIIRALENNPPDNYGEYNFMPTSQINANSYYDYNNKTIANYQTNSEIININGYNYEIAQVLPKDCTKTEMLAYNFGKANIINTMRTLPDKYLELCSKGNTNVITLTCNKQAMNNSGNWSGYYKPSALFNNRTNMITIDIHGSFYDNTYYTQDTIIHEMGHKFDDMMYDKNIIDWIFGRTSYTVSNNKWNDLYKKYGNVLSAINLGGYESYPNVNEFFGDATVAYFKNPDEIKTLCPEVYNQISNMLDGEYGYSYDDKMMNILNITG